MKKSTGLLLASGAVVAGAGGFWLCRWLRPQRDPLPPGTVADYVLVEKRAHRLSVFSAHKKLRSYRVAIGRGGAGIKRSGWDGRTPEGLYRIAGHDAARHALRLNYPSEQDLAMAERRHRSPAGQILIQGPKQGLGWLGVAQRLFDWTSGSIGLTNPEMAELYYVIPDGVPVEIRA